MRLIILSIIVIYAWLVYLSGWYMATSAIAFAGGLTTLYVVVSLWPIEWRPRFYMSYHSLRLSGHSIVASIKTAYHHHKRGRR